MPQTRSINPYTSSIVIMGVVCLLIFGLAMLLVKDAATLGVVLTLIAGFTIQAIGIILVMFQQDKMISKQESAAVKQEEIHHQTNSRLDELVKMAAELGNKQGREDLTRELKQKVDRQ